jgi:hypothetical protein
VVESDTVTPTVIVLPTQTPIILPSATPAPTLSATTVPTKVPAVYLAPTKYVAPTTPPAAQATGLTNDDHYTNVDGNEIHSPANSIDGSIPAGATARCGDDSYSFSQHHSGTCSHHGGVASWL